MSNVAVVDLAKPNPAADLDISTLKLGPQSLSTDLADALIDAELERAIDNSSTLNLTFDDEARDLVRSALFTYGSVLTIDNIEFALVGVQKQGNNLVVAFEDRVITLLKHQFGFRRAYRGGVTRAEFILMLLRELPIKVPFYCPQLHDAQPVTPTKFTATQRKTLKKPGAGSTAGLKIHGAPAKPSALRNAQTLIDVGVQLNINYKVMHAMIVAAINEDAIQNNPRGDAAGPDSRGIFSQRNPYGTVAQRMNPATATRIFLLGVPGKGIKGAIQRDKDFPTATVAQLAVLTQFPGLSSLAAVNALNYQGISIVGSEAKWVGEAKAILDAFGVFDNKGSADASQAASRSVVAQQRFPFVRKKNEDSWTCMKRLADEVNWQLFMHDGVMYFIAEDELMASEPQMVFSESDDGIQNIDFNADTGYRANTATITCHADRWTAPPGTVAVLEGLGDHASGRWLVTDIHRSSLFQPDTEITISRPTPGRREPAADTTTVQTSVTKQGTLFDAMKVLDSWNINYVYGGGHGPALNSLTKGYCKAHGLDCSSSTSLVLWMAGLFPGSVAITSGAFNTWGKPGKGKTFTVWYKGTHVFIQMHGSNWGGFTQFNTVPGGGPHFRHGQPSTPGPPFLPRHWPGL